MDKDLEVLTLCRMSYGGEFTGYKVEQVLSIKGVQMYHLKKGDYNYIVFTGTNEPRDWVRNLNVNITEHGFHQGFYNASAQVKRAINNIMIKVVMNGEYIVFTGHSLGGAVATLAYIYSLNYPRKSLVTFGSPKIQYRYKIREGIHWQYNQDFAPLLPFRFKGYEGAMWLNYNGEHIEHPNRLTRAYNRLKSVLRAWSKGEWFNEWYDHSLESYEKAVKAYKSRFII